DAVTQSVTEKVRAMLQDQIRRAFKGEETIINLVIRHGIVYRELHSEVSRIAADMLVVGVKKRTSVALTPSRVAHGFDCAVFFAPEGKPLSWNRLMVPVDLSRNSGRMLRLALEMMKAGSDQAYASVTGVHVVQNLPIHYYYGFELNDTYIDQRSEEARVAFRQMIAEEGLDQSAVTEVHLDDKHGNVATHLYNYCAEHPCDLVVMNARGHSHLSNLLVGSVAEKFVNYCKHVPILLMR
nr:universal stress protein [Saprospiraceae bacterium]